MPIYHCIVTGPIPGSLAEKISDTLTIHGREDDNDAQVENSKSGAGERVMR